MLTLLLLLAAGPQAPPMTVLEPGETVTRAFAPGGRDVYTVPARAGELVHVRVDQDGIDVVVTAEDPGAAAVRTVDAPNGHMGPEQMRFIAEVSGEFRIVLTSLQKTGDAGRYAITLAARRPATEHDQRVELALAAKIAADRLRADPQTRADSLPAYERAIALWREAGDLTGEADTLRAMGFALVRLKDDARAYPVFARTLELWRKLGDTRSEAYAHLILGTIHTRRDEHDDTRRQAHLALPLWRKAGDRVQEAFTLGEIGSTYAREGQREEMERWYAEARAVARSAKRPALEAAIEANYQRAVALLEKVPRA